MKKLIFILTTVFTLSSFADCPEGDRNCAPDKGAGFIAVGGDCSDCKAYELGEPRIESPKNGNAGTHNKTNPSDEKSSDTVKSRK